MKKALSLLCAALLLLSVLAPRAGAADEPAPEQKTAVITDLLGRRVTVPLPASRAAALGETGRWLVYAGAADRITGVTDRARQGEEETPWIYINRMLFDEADPVSDGKTPELLYLEELVVMDPDVIFWDTDDRRAADELSETLQIPVVVLHVRDITDPRLIRAVRLAGMVMGTSDRAEPAADALRDALQDIRRRVDAAETRPACYIAGAGAEELTASTGSYETLELLSAGNVVPEEGLRTVEKTDIAAVDPDVILVCPGAAEALRRDYAADARFYQKLTAVANGRIYTVPGLFHTGAEPELLLADAWYLGSVLYPEEFADVDPEAAARELFRTLNVGGYYHFVRSWGDRGALELAPAEEP